MREEWTSTRPRIYAYGMMDRDRNPNVLVRGPESALHLEQEAQLQFESAKIHPDAISTHIFDGQLSQRGIRIGGQRSLCHS